MQSNINILKKIALMISALNFLLADYPDINIIVNDNPYSSNLFIHTMSTSNPHMAILDPSLSIKWEVNSGEHGMDFKANNGLLTYFYKPDQFWIIANENMIEVDTLSCIGARTDYHDIRLLDNGGYILQGYDSLWVDMTEIVDGGLPDWV